MQIKGRREEMKYKIATILLITALICGTLPLINTLSLVKASPATIHVPTDYPTISLAIAAANPGDIIIVSGGTYLETLQINKPLTISAVGHVIVQGGAMFSTHYGSRQAVVFVTGTSNVVLNGLDVEGQGLGGGGTKSYAILYESSSGTVQGCIASPNTATTEDTSSTAIAAWDNSILTVQGCTVENFGRVGIYANNATMIINGNTIVGQQYTDPSLVSYGIEIEDYTGACVATITNNNIYNCGNTSPSNPSWSSAGIIADIFRYYDMGSLQPSALSIASNNIHDNFEAIELVPNSMSYAHYNNITNNLWGVWTDTDENGNSGSFDARFNWWGNSSGPLANVDVDPATVVYSGFLTAPFAARLYTSPTPVLKAYGDIGTTFTLDVEVGGIQDLFGFDINLTWDNSLIAFVGCNYNSTLNTLWPSGWFLQQNTTGVNGGTGWFRLVAVSTSGGFTTTSGQTLFTLTFQVEKGSNVQQLQTSIHFASVQLSNSLYTAIPAGIVDGLYQISPTTPDLELQLIDPNPSKPFEYGKTFEVQVNVTDVCSQLTEYSLTFIYNTELFSLTSVSWVGGVLGTGSYTESPQGTVNIQKTGGGPWSGKSGLLFTLSFNVQFDDSASHIWRTNTPNYLTRNISLQDARLTFTDGTLTTTGIQMPAALNITIHLIQGDVTCDGQVDIFDLVTVAHYYDKTSSDPQWSTTIQKYDLNNDGSIDLYDLVAIATNFNYGT